MTWQMTSIASTELWHESLKEMIELDLREESHLGMAQESHLHGWHVVGNAAYVLAHVMWHRSLTC